MRSIVIGFTIVMLTACARTVVSDALDTNYDSSDPSSDLEFLSRLADQTAVSNDAGLHALIMFASGADVHTSYVDRVADAKARGWLPESWNEASSLAMQRGTIAPAIAQICKIRGGVVMRTVGPTQRYASRELAYLGILTPGSEQQTMTGREFMSILGKAQDYILIEEALEKRQVDVRSKRE